MNSKILTDEFEASALHEKLVSEDNTVYTEITNEGTYWVKWVKNKKYTTFDNKEFNDEAWLTEDGELILVQNLTEAHAKNIVRMMLRKNKQFVEVLDEILNAQHIELESLDMPVTLH